MAKAGKIKNDIISCQLPIGKGLLEILIFELQRILDNSQYFYILYKAIFCLGYYGLMRVGELTDGSHTIKASNMHIGANKDKILVILYTSKTHSRASYPQEVKISSVAEDFKLSARTNSAMTMFFCPFQAIRDYVNLRGGYVSVNENFFVFADRSPVKPHHLQTILRKCLFHINLQPKLYDCHSFRIGRSCDLAKAGMPLYKIKLLGRWKSNAVYKYIRNF